MLRFVNNLLIRGVVALLLVGRHGTVAVAVAQHAHADYEGGEKEKLGVNHLHVHDDEHHHHPPHHHPLAVQGIQHPRRLGLGNSITSPKSTSTATDSSCNDDSDPTYYSIGGVIYNCKSDFHARGGVCGTINMSPEEQDMAVEDFTLWKDEKEGRGGRIGSSSRSSERRRLEGGGCGDCVDWNASVITIPTYFHVIHSGKTGKQFTYASNPSYIRKQIMVMNTGFRGEETRFYDPHPGGRSYARYDVLDADTKIQFCLAGTTATDNAAWYTDSIQKEVEMKSALKIGGSETLNVYVTTAGGYLGWAYFPQRKDFVLDGIVLLNDSMPGGAASGFNEGDTLTHEVGHWLQLEHTHEYGCDGPGDYMDLAPKSSKYVSRKSNEAGMTFDCPVNLNNCVGDCGKNPIHNFMSYADDNCMDQFSPGQKMKVQQAWETYRHKVGYSELISLAADGYSCLLSGMPLTPTPSLKPSSRPGMSFLY